MKKNRLKGIFEGLATLSPQIHKYYRDWGVLRSSNIGLLILNFIVQRIFRINGRVPYPLHFTNKVVNADKFRIIGSGERIIYCLSVNGGCYFQAANGIEIHSGVLIAAGVKIISGNHDFSDLSSSATAADPIIIKQNVWIGANAVILPGVTVEEDCIIGAGSVVTKSVLEKGAIVAGNPARRIGNKYDKDRRERERHD